MSADLGPLTRVFALLGDPVEHSLSPAIQNAAFRAESLDGIYVALRCAPEDVGGLVRGLAGAGGGGNVTLPHKERCAEALDVPSAAVTRTGACNTFWSEDGRVFGDNTDVEGFRRALRTLLNGSPEGARVLLVGAGGASRAVLIALLEDGVEEVTIANRTSARADELARLAASSRVRVVPDPLPARGEGFDIVVNATRLGLHAGDPSPVDLEGMGSAQAVMDLVYGPSETLLVRDARARGIRAADGGEMLVHQGAAAFERWWRRTAPLDVMRAALQASRVG
jgi:shikimate dehydrogenase